MRGQKRRYGMGTVRYGTIRRSVSDCEYRSGKLASTTGGAATQSALGNQSITQGAVGEYGATSPFSERDTLPLSAAPPPLSVSTPHACTGGEGREGGRRGGCTGEEKGEGHMPATTPHNPV